MGFASFLDAEGVTNIDARFASVMDSVGEPIVRAAYGIPSTPSPATSAIALASAIPAALGALSSQGPSVAPGAALLMTALAADIDAQICLRLSAGAVMLAVVPPGLGGPGGPVAPIALAAGPAAANPKFCRAALKWAISLVVPGDLRLVSPLTI